MVGVFLYDVFTLWLIQYKYTWSLYLNQRTAISQQGWRTSWAACGSFAVPLAAFQFIHVFCVSIIYLFYIMLQWCCNPSSQKQKIQMFGNRPSTVMAHRWTESIWHKQLNWIRFISRCWEMPLFQYCFGGVRMSNMAAFKLLSMFGSTFICESFFLHWKQVKSMHRSVLTDTRVKELLQVATTEYKPELKRIMENKDCQVSHWV